MAGFSSRGPAAFGRPPGLSPSLRAGAALALLALLTAALSADAQKTKPRAAREVVIAIFPFKVLNPENKYKHFGEGAADAIITHVVRDGALKVVEESQLEKAIKTLSRNQSGLFEEESALTLGRMVDARFIVLGSVDVVAEQMALSARVLEVETRELLVAERVHGPLADAFGLYQKLAVRLTDAIQRHLALRVTVAQGDQADAVVVQDLLKRGKAFDPLFGGADLGKAIHWYRKAVLRDPNHAVARFALGQALAQAGSFPEAKHNLELAVKLNPKHVPAITWLGYAEDKLGNAEEGRARYQEAIDLDPDFALARYWLAANLVNEGQIEEAKVHADAALKLGEQRAARLLEHINQRIAYEKKVKDKQAER